MKFGRIMPLRNKKVLLVNGSGSGDLTDLTTGTPVIFEAPGYAPYNVYDLSLLRVGNEESGRRDLNTYQLSVDSTHGHGRNKDKGQAANNEQFERKQEQKQEENVEENELSADKVESEDSESLPEEGLEAAGGSEAEESKQGLKEPKLNEARAKPVKITKEKFDDMLRLGAKSAKRAKGSGGKNKKIKAEELFLIN